MLLQKQISIPSISFKTILATKISDTILSNEDGSLFYVAQDDFYPKGLFGYWQLFYRNNTWYIDSILVTN